MAFDVTEPYIKKIKNGPATSMAGAWEKTKYPTIGTKVTYSRLAVSYHHT